MKSRKDYIEKTKHFIKVWQEATTIEEVAEALGCSRQYVHRRAQTLRGNGIELKRHNRPRGVMADPLVYDELKKTAEEYAPEEDLLSRQDWYNNFVYLWQTSDSVNTVAEALDLTENRVSQIASQLRRYGVKLVKRKRGKKSSVDIDELNAIAKEALQ